jgi:hypothetical protein
VNFRILSAFGAVLGAMPLAGQAHATSLQHRLNGLRRMPARETSMLLQAGQALLLVGLLARRAGPSKTPMMQAALAERGQLSPVVIV